MGWFSKKKWYIVTWKFENWSSSTYMNIVKATCGAHAAHKVIKKNGGIIVIIKVEEIEGDNNV